MKRALVTVGMLLLGGALAWQGLRAQAPAPQAQSPGRVVKLDAALDAIVDADATIEKVAGGFGFVEGPVWTRDGALLFSDIPANAIMRWMPGGQASIFRQPAGYTGTETRAPGSHIGSNGLTIDREGRLLVAEHGDRRISRIDAGGQRTTVADKYDGKRLNSPNDVVVKSDGSIYFTDPPYGLPRQAQDPAKEIPFSGIYRVVGDKVTLLAQELAFPNGLAFSPDEKTLYVANSDPARRLWMRYEVKADGTLGAATIFYDASSETARGIPDGLKVDLAGNVFGTGPGGVLIISPAGKLLGRIELPEPPANVAFGDDGRSLYMTARTSVYRVRLVKGGKRPVVSLAGRKGAGLWGVGAPTPPPPHCPPYGVPSDLSSASARSRISS
jgi:gluconolactonase